MGRTLPGLIKLGSAHVKALEKEHMSDGLGDVGYLARGPKHSPPTGRMAMLF
jgi:hypothetical protein